MVLGALVLALAATGCGDGGSEASPPTTAPMTKAQFLRQGNAICARANDEVNRRFETYSRRHLTNDGPMPSDHSYAKASARIVLPLVARKTEELRELGVPSGDEAEVERILRAFEQGIEAGERDPTLVAGQGPYAFTEAHELAIDYGLTRCALG